MIILEVTSSWEGAATPPPAVPSDVLQVLLDVPEGAGAGLQLGHLVFCQGHVDHTGHAAAVQHAGQTQVHLVTDSIHALCTRKNSLTVCMCFSNTETTETNCCCPHLSKEIKKHA